MAPMSRAKQLYGTDEAPPPRILLAAGPLSAA